MTTQELTSWRLHNQRIMGSNHMSPLEVVRHMGAMQAQDYDGTLWALGLRTGQTKREIVRVLEGQQILRTWPQRGTLHMVPSADATWLVGLSAERLLRDATGRREQLGLDAATLARSEQVVTQALKQTPLLTRPAVMALLEEAGISTASGRGYHILWYLSQSGITYIGSMEGKQQTIGLLGALVPKPVRLSRAEGISELARRYFTSHGPATLKDFQWWTGLTMADARAGLEANRDLLTSEAADDKTYWMPKHAANGASENEAFLLPGFDEYLLGYTDRSGVLPPEHAPKVVPGNNGVFLPTIVIGGQVIGTWARTVKKNHVQLELCPFRPLTPVEKDLLARPLEDYGRFMGLPLNPGIVKP